MQKIFLMSHNYSGILQQVFTRYVPSTKNVFAVSPADVMPESIRRSTHPITLVFTLCIYYCDIYYDIYKLIHVASIKIIGKCFAAKTQRKFNKTNLINHMTARCKQNNLHAEFIVRYNNILVVEIPFVGVDRIRPLIANDNSSTSFYPRDLRRIRLVLESRLVPRNQFAQEYTSVISLETFGQF
jgi:hypothetical protein